MHLVTDLKHLIKKIMEEAAAELDNKFQETEKKLDNVSWKVEQLVKEVQSMRIKLSWQANLAPLFSTNSHTPC